MIFLAARTCKYDVQVCKAWILYHAVEIRKHDKLYAAIFYNRQSHEEELAEHELRAYCENLQVKFFVRIMEGWDNTESIIPIESLARFSGASHYIHMDCDEFINDVPAFIKRLKELKKGQCLKVKMKEFIPKRGVLLDDANLHSFSQYKKAAKVCCKLLESTRRPTYKLCGFISPLFRFIHHTDDLVGVEHEELFFYHYSFRTCYVPKMVKRLGTLANIKNDWDWKIVTALKYFGYNKKGKKL